MIKCVQRVRQQLVNGGADVYQRHKYTFKIHSPICSLTQTQARGTKERKKNTFTAYRGTKAKFNNNQVKIRPFFCTILAHPPFKYI